MNPFIVIKKIFLFFNPSKQDSHKMQRPKQHTSSGFFLITLSDFKDVNICIVNHEVWNWIMDKNFPAPTDVQDHLKTYPLPDSPTVNDRALWVTAVDCKGLNGEIVAHFNSVKELSNYLENNLLVISDAYEGYLY